MLDKIIQLIAYYFNTKNSINSQEGSNIVETHEDREAMNISKRGLLELADREGLSQTKYLDSVGVQTIGIGSTKSDIKDLDKWAWTKELSVKECVDLYKQHIVPYVNAVSNALKVQVTQNQFDALVSITYNIGISGMVRSTFIERINQKADIGQFTLDSSGEMIPTKNSIIQAILMWDKPSEIKGRRIKEVLLFKSGAYQNKDGCVDSITVNLKTHKPRYSGRVSIKEYL